MTAFEAWASQVGQIGNGARDPSPTFTGLVAPRSGMGHQDQFVPTSPSVGCAFGQETFAGVRSNGRDAPIGAVRRTSRTHRPAATSASVRSSPLPGVSIDEPSGRATAPSSKGGPLSNRNGRDQIGTSGRLAPEPAGCPTTGCNVSQRLSAGYRRRASARESFVQRSG